MINIITGTLLLFLSLTAQASHFGLMFQSMPKAATIYGNIYNFCVQYPT